MGRQTAPVRILWCSQTPTSINMPKHLSLVALCEQPAARQLPARLLVAQWPHANICTTASQQKQKLNCIAHHARLSCLDWGVLHHDMWMSCPATKFPSAVSFSKRSKKKRKREMTKRKFHKMTAGGEATAVCAPMPSLWGKVQQWLPCRMSVTHGSCCADLAWA